MLCQFPAVVTNTRGNFSWEGLLWRHIRERSESYSGRLVKVTWTDDPIHWSLFSSIRVATTKYHRLGSLQTTDIYFTWLLEDRSPKSDCLNGQILCLGKAYFLVHLRPSSCCNLMLGGKGNSLRPFWYKVPFIKAEPWWPNYLPKAPHPNPSPRALCFQYMPFGGI